ncbi:DUF4293 domain-containing protein [Prevotella disiens]|uniref:DUF4293 domain-containing protein n=1 Tax=Prevotella disiens TaxID=28130 RepID=UPI00336AB272
MIQRKQTIFLFLSFIIILLCLCFPIGWLESKGMGTPSNMTNLWIEGANEAKDFKVWPLFAILLLSLPCHLFTIFDYKNRKRQIKSCGFYMLLNIIWYGAYIVMTQIMLKDVTFHFSYAACLPLVSLILLFLSRQAIKADEALVRAADRIR